MAGLDSIKRAARKEAWYSDSYNPFRKNMTRSRSWGPSRAPEDIERGVNGGTLEATSTAPAHRRSSQYETDNIRRGSKENEHEMTSAGNGTGSGAGKEREADSEETAVERSNSRQPSQELKARRRFISRFHKRADNDGAGQADNRKSNKRPWYKGKVLKHKPFTLRNQLGATIFNSWVNILLLAAPVGIAINYAGVNGKIVFVVNFIAIIPLAGMLSFATEEIALHVGESLGGLLNASFGYTHPLTSPGVY